MRGGGGGNIGRMKRLAWALLGSAAVAAAALAQPADVPYGPAVAARFPAPAVRYETPGLRDGHDINRDHLLLRTPEARAVAALVRRFEPIAVVDAHEHTVVGRYLQKFGALPRNDLLIQQATTANLESELTEAGESMFLAPLR